MVKRSKIKWVELDRILRQIGFKVRVDPGKARVYQRPVDEEFRLILPDHRQSNLVTMIHLIGVRSQLDDFGIMSRDAFDALVAKRKAARVTA